MLPGRPTTDAIATDRTLAWHYTSGAGLLSILAGHVLWATSASFLNDKQEVALGGQLMAARIQELAEQDETGFYTRLAERVVQSAQRGVGPGPAHFYILSASQSGDSLAMWRLYGGAQESYAIGLDTTAGLAALSTGAVIDDRAPGLYLSHQRWQPVQYDDAGQRALVDDVVLDLPARTVAFREHFERKPDGGDPGVGPLPEPDDDLLDDLEQALLLIKHPGFTDERETRYCVILGARPDAPSALEVESRLLTYRATSYGIAPYLRLTGGAPDRSDAVTDTPTPLPIRAVSISPSPNGPEAEASVRRLLAAHGYADVPVLRSAIPFRG